MTLMVWNDDLVTGIDIVDREHRGLVDLINRAAPMLATARGEEARAGIGPLLDSLVDYAASHFRSEEELMARLAMDAGARAHHEASHAGFTEQVGAMIADYRNGRDIGGDHLLSFLASWLVLHILGEDQAMARQIHALEAGESADRALRVGRGDELAPTPEAMTRAMVEVYAMLTRQNRELLQANLDLDASRTQIRHHNESLEETVRARTAELERLAGDLRAARDQAEAGSRAKSRFLGTMSHELRTPMNAILGFSRLLRDQGLPAGQDELARHIVEASERLLELLGGILDYARLENGEADTAVEEDFDPAALIAEACEPGFAVARAKGVATSLTLAEDLPAGVRGDAGALRDILRQLVDNAAKFTRAGAISARVSRADDVDDGRARLRFEVSDTGIGIDAAARARLFQPFSQADDRAGRQFEGLGLGLALARERARRLGGEIGVDSEPGRGSRFHLDIALPVTRPAVAGAVTSTAPRPSAAATPEATPGNHATGPMPADLRAGLVELHRYLVALDTRAGPRLAELGPRLRPWLGDAVERLDERIAAFDYDGAIALLRAAAKASTEKPA